MPGMINRVQRELQMRSDPENLLNIVALTIRQVDDTARQMSMKVF